MGKTLRSGGSGTVGVNVRPSIKTCESEVGILPLNLRDGTEIVALGYPLYPSHDRPLVAMVQKLLARVRPDLTFCMGGMFLEESFKLLCDEEDVASDLTGVKQPSEIAAIKEAHVVVEKRFLELAKLCGKFIAGFANASGKDLYYIPSISRPLPNEIDAHLYCLEKHRYLNKWADKHPEEAKYGPNIPKDFATFLGLQNRKRVKVLPYGSAITVNNELLFKIGDYRRANPGTAVLRDMDKHGMSVVRSFDGKVSSLWKTLPGNTYPRPTRRFQQGHEIGHLFSLKDGLGFLRDYDWRAQGIWYGTVVGGKVFGFSIPVQMGADGRRFIALNGIAYHEDEPSDSVNFLKMRAPACAIQPTRRKKK